MIYLIYVVSAVSSACVIFWLSVYKFQKNEKIYVLDSVYIAEVNVLFYFTLSVQFYTVISVLFYSLHLVFDFTLGVRL